MNHLAVFIIVCSVIGFSEVDHFKTNLSIEMKIKNFDVSFMFISKE